MRTALLALLSVATALSAADAQTTITIRNLAANQATGYGVAHLSDSAIAGQQILVWSAVDINPDCGATGAMTTRVLQEPHHGQLRLSDDMIFPNFVPPNPRATCDHQKVPGREAFYTADPNFHGTDKLVLENATPEGRIRKIEVKISVR